MKKRFELSFPKLSIKRLADFEISQGSYTGIFQKSDFRKNPSDKHDKISRLWDLESLNLLSRKFVKRIPPKSKKLRKDLHRPRINLRFNFFATKLTTCTFLPVERYKLPNLCTGHKAITCTRTDSKALPKTMATLSH